MQEAGGMRDAEHGLGGQRSEVGTDTQTERFDAGDGFIARRPRGCHRTDIGSTGWETQPAFVLQARGYGVAGTAIAAISHLGSRIPDSGSFASKSKRKKTSNAQRPMPNA